MSSSLTLEELAVSLVSYSPSLGLTLKAYYRHSCRPSKIQGRDIEENWQNKQIRDKLFYWIKESIFRHKNQDRIYDISREKNN